MSISGTSTLQVPNVHFCHLHPPRIPPNEVSIKRNGVWTAMTKSSDGYWVLSDGVEMTNTNDIPVWVTAINGEQLSDTVPQLGKPAMFVLSRGLFHFWMLAQSQMMFRTILYFSPLVYSHTAKPYESPAPPSS